MSNLYTNAEESRGEPDFVFNILNGLNQKDSAKRKITIKGSLDEFTVKTLYENYEIIARNLKVYPEVIIYPRSHMLSGGVEGLYYAEQNKIEIVDDFYLISMIAHEMRHAYQYIYFPDLYFKASYSSVATYLDCAVERDARMYGRDYCYIRKYYEEVQVWDEWEKQFELVIQKRIPAESIGFDEEYFRENPSIPEQVPRSYHRSNDQDNSNYNRIGEEDVQSIFRNKNRKSYLGSNIKMLLIIATLISFIILIFR